LEKEKIFSADRLFAVIFGGKGHEREISCRTAGNIIETARRIGYNVLPVGIDRSGNFCVYLGDTEKITNGECFSDRERLLPAFPIRSGDKCGFFVEGKTVAVITSVVALHGDHGEDGRVQGLLDCAGIPYTGADTVSGALAYDKAAAKALAEKLGIPTAPWVLLTDLDVAAARSQAEAVGYPMFIKPSGLGSSVGAACVLERSSFDAAYRNAYSLGGGRVLAERYVDKRLELECAYLCASGIRAVTPPGSINTDGLLYDYSAKYEDKTASVCAVADVSEQISRLARSYTERICKAFSLRHLARVDYFLTVDGELLFNEINTFPGMTDGSLYAAMLSEYGISFEDVVSALLEAPLREVL
jgi:D-alanine--D-alanine ligase